MIGSWFLYCPCLAVLFGCSAILLTACWVWFFGVATALSFNAFSDLSWLSLRSSSELVFAAFSPFNLSNDSPDLSVVTAASLLGDGRSVDNVSVFSVSLFLSAWLYSGSTSSACSCCTLSFALYSGSTVFLLSIAFVWSDCCSVCKLVLFVFFHHSLVYDHFQPVLLMFHSLIFLIYHSPIDSHSIVVPLFQYDGLLQ